MPVLLPEDRVHLFFIFISLPFAITAVSFFTFLHSVFQSSSMSPLSLFLISLFSPSLLNTHIHTHPILFVHIFMVYKFAHLFCPKKTEFNMYQKGLCSGTNMFYSKQFHCRSIPHQNQYLSTFMDMAKYSLEFVERYRYVHHTQSILLCKERMNGKEGDTQRKRNV